MKPTILDEIADLISEVELPEKTAEDLRDLMSRYEQEGRKYPHNLLRVPGFRKLWVALGESWRFSLRHGELQDEMEAAERRAGWDPNP